MRTHQFRVQSSNESLPFQDQLAWKLAEVAADRSPVTDDVREMIGNRLLDSVGVAVAAANRRSVVTARAQALAHPDPRGATLFGLPPEQRVSCEWAAWANTAAIRELDFNDMFVGADYAHPSDSIPTLLAVAQQCGRSGSDLLFAIACAYEVHVALARAICLFRHDVDTVLHLGPATVAGIGALLALPAEVTYQALQHIAHVGCMTRQSRYGSSTWRSVSSAHMAKLAVEAVDRAMRGETAPSPVYEGQAGIFSTFLDGPTAAYEVLLPATGEVKRAVFETYPKAHEAQYQSQALIDLAFDLRAQTTSSQQVSSIVIATSSHMHHAVGTAWRDESALNLRQPAIAHQIAYIMAVILEDGRWQGAASCPPVRGERESTRRLQDRIRTVEDPLWSKRSHVADPTEQSFGGNVTMLMRDGRSVTASIERSHAHVLGRNDWDRKKYIEKFLGLSADEWGQAAQPFISACYDVSRLSPAELARFNLVTASAAPAARPGIFDCRIEGT